MKQIDEIEKILGYRPNRAMMLHLLQQVKDEGISLAEACSRAMLAPVAIMQPDGTFYCVEVGRNITPKEWESLNPANKYLTLITIKSA